MFWHATHVVVAKALPGFAAPGNPGPIAARSDLKEDFMPGFVRQLRKNVAPVVSFWLHHACLNGLAALLRQPAGAVPRLRPSA